MKRRTFLIAGGSSILILGALATIGLQSDLSDARAPWTIPVDEISDPRILALSYAILAPSPHNRQPWLVSLEGKDRLTLFCDTERLLLETDPFNRQVTVGLGAFIETLRMAAVKQGFWLEIDLFPDGEPQPVLDDRTVAHIQFVKTTASPDPLFDYVLDRRTNRQEFEASRVPDQVLSALTSSLSQENNLVGSTSETELVKRIKSVCLSGWEVEMTLPRTHHESTRLTRVGEKEINASPDGISLSGPLMELLGRTSQMTEKKMNDPNSNAFRGTMKFYSNLIKSASTFLWLVSPDNSRESQIKAGMDWMRLHLAATREGLAFHPLSQLLQEFPEMKALYNETHEMLGVERPNVIQGLFRLGYAKAPKPSPRWPLETRLVEI